jgi:hypothetical protein
MRSNRVPIVPSLPKPHGPDIGPTTLPVLQLVDDAYTGIYGIGAIAVLIAWAITVVVLYITW